MNFAQRMLGWFAVLVLAIAPASAVQAHGHRPPAGAGAGRRAPVTILISIDGFRADYLGLGLTPNLAALAGEGVSAAMRPSFPAVTFPQHWTLVTGLVPDHHGVVNGIMRDAGHPGELFGKESNQAFWWDGGEPIWVAAKKAGIPSAALFWPGSYGAVRGVRPESWIPFSKDFTPAQEADIVVDWMRRPAASRPRLVTVYFGDVDVAGHHFGPGSAQVAAAMGAIDAAIGKIRMGLRGIGQRANVIVVSDHGMAAVDQSRVLQLSDYADPADYVPISGGGMLQVDAVPGHEAALATGLAKLPGYVHCWPKSQLPARFHYGANPRVAGFVCLPDIGARVLVTPIKNPPDRGDHGYDNDAPEMRALFIAAGPAFARGKRLPEFDNVDVEPLLRDLVGLPQGTPRDGSDAPFRPVLLRK